MARVTVRLPGVLAQVTGTKKMELDADTLDGGIKALMAAAPELRVHLFDEAGELRQHVNCFHNEDNLRWLDDLDRPLTDGDQITIVQAVSGG